MNGNFIGFPSFHRCTLNVMKWVGVVGLLTFGVSQSAVAQRVDGQEHRALYEQGFSSKQVVHRIQTQLDDQAFFARGGQLRAEKTEFFLKGYRYEVTNEEKKEVQLVLLKEDDPQYPNCYEGNVNIPATIEVEGKTYTVTSIGRGAFYTKKILSLQIPETIRLIDRAAFAYCTGVKEIRIPDSVTELGDRAFAFCNDARSLYIGKNVAKVGADVFEDCYYLQKIEVGEGNPIYSIRDGILYNKDQSELLKCPSYRKDFKELTLP